MFELLQEGKFEELYKYALIGAAIRIFFWLIFAFTIRRTLKLVKKENQCILPNQTWFVAVPLFNIFWNFEIAKRLSDSLNNEFYDRKVEVEDNPTRKWGLLYAWTFLLSNIPFPVTIIASLGLLNLIYFGTYWIKIYQHQSLLKLHIDHYGENYIAEQDED